MYILYMPKGESEKKDFLITEAIKVYMQNTWYRCGIICAPGYRGTTEETIREFMHNLSKLFKPGGKQSKVIKFKSDSSKEDINNLYNEIGFDPSLVEQIRRNPCLRDTIKIGILRGMGKISADNKSDIIDELYSRAICSINNLEEILIVQNDNNRDHRKMMIFFEIKEDMDFASHGPLYYENIEQILNSIKPKAILIGSSNQNLNTYYGGKNGTADKGEADVLLFDDINVYNAILKEKDGYCKRLMDDGILAKSEKLKDGDTEYLIRILKNILRQNLGKKS